VWLIEGRDLTGVLRTFENREDAASRATPREWHVHRFEAAVRRWCSETALCWGDLYDDVAPAGAVNQPSIGVGRNAARDLVIGCWAFEVTVHVLGDALVAKDLSGPTTA
jgi:hypothetical protein